LCIFDPQLCRYAANGDANGGPISHTDEGEKFAQLEREVLAYPGFVEAFYAHPEIAES